MADTTLPNHAAAPQSAAAVPPGATYRFVVLAAIGAVLFIAGPWMFDTYLLNILIKAFFFAIAAITVDILWGYTGYLSFGQSAFFGSRLSLQRPGISRSSMLSASCRSSSPTLRAISAP